MACGGCNLTYLRVIKQIYENDSEAINIFKDHGVLIPNVICPKCNSECSYRSDKNLFVCRRVSKDNRSRKSKCKFHVSAYKGTWLANTLLNPWKNLLFINIYLRKEFSQIYATDDLGLSSSTVVNWKSFCGEICEYWLGKQTKIGGPNSIVEIDESKFGKTKYNRGRLVTGVWVFGGIERGSKRRFMLTVPDRSRHTLLPLIKHYVHKGTTIYTDEWKAYYRIPKLGYGYTHKTINHSKNFVAPVTGVHTQNIERTWKDAKGWILRSGNKKEHYSKYIARYLFCKATPKRLRLHHFLHLVAELYEHA